MSYPPSSPYGYGYYLPPALQRPASVLFVAVFSIIVAALGLLCELLLVAIASAPDQPPNPLITAIQADPAAQRWIIALAVARMLLSLLLLAASIGFLLLRPWGRTLLNAWSALAIFLALGACGIGFSQIAPAIEASGVSFDLPEADDRAVAAAVPVAFSCAGYLAALWAVVVLIVANLPGVRAAIAGEAPPGYPGYPPGSYGVPGYYPPGYDPGYTQPYPPPPQSPPPPQGDQPPGPPPHSQ